MRAIHRLNLVTVNVDFTDGAHVGLDNFVRVYPGAALGFVQEAKHIDLRDELTGLLGVQQGESSAAAGSALVWDKTRLHRHKRGQELGARAVKGATQDRLLQWVDLEYLYLPGVMFRAVGGHRPPRYAGHAARKEFDGNAARLIARSPYPVIFGLDANELRPRQWAARTLGLSWRGKGIDGFAYTPSLDLGPATRLPKTRSDHRAVTSVLSMRAPVSSMR